jgi:hypothetical protein
MDADARRNRRLGKQWGDSQISLNLEILHKNGVRHTGESRYPGGGAGLEPGFRLSPE